MENKYSFLKTIALIKCFPHTQRERMQKKKPKTNK